MSYKAIYTYAWDLEETGVSRAVDEFTALGLDTVTIAGSYHAGKFLRPHGRDGKVVFPQDGTVYFRPDPTRYGEIKPLTNGIVARADILAELCDQSRMRTNVWLVLLHNTPVASAHPDATVTNAFGDRYIYALCPSAPEARAYAIGLASDVTRSYPVHGISMESVGFPPYAHGFHHEFGLVRPNRWLENLLGLCFCRHCVAGAEAAGIDAAGLRRRVAEDVGAYLDGSLDIPDDMADAFWFADTRSDGVLNAYLAWRCTVVTSLVREIRRAVRPDATVAVIPSVARPTAGCWYEGSDLGQLVEATGIVEACFYEASARRVRADCVDVARRLRGRGTLRGILRPSYPDIESKPEFLDAMRALGGCGVSEVAFYNWGHLRRDKLAWIADGLKALEAAT